MHEMEKGNWPLDKIDKEALKKSQAWFNQQEDQGWRIEIDKYPKLNTSLGKRLHNCFVN